MRNSKVTADVTGAPGFSAVGDGVENAGKGATGYFLIRLKRSCVCVDSSVPGPVPASPEGFILCWQGLAFNFDSGHVKMSSTSCLCKNMPLAFSFISPPPVSGVSSRINFNSLLTFSGSSFLFFSGSLSQTRPFLHVARAAHHDPP